MEPLRILSTKAFPRSQDDVLAIAGEAMSQIYTNDGQMLWRITQGVTGLPTSRNRFFLAMATYTYAYQSVSTGYSSRSTVAMRATISANELEKNGSVYCGFLLDFIDTSGGDMTAFELIAVATCVYLTQLLRARQWIADDQGPGFWRLTNRDWRHQFIKRAQTGNPQDVSPFAVSLQHYGLFPVITPSVVDEAIWVRRLFQP